MVRWVQAAKAHHSSTHASDRVYTWRSRWGDGGLPPASRVHTQSTRKAHTNTQHTHKVLQRTHISTHPQSTQHTHKAHTSVHTHKAHTQSTFAKHTHKAHTHKAHRGQQGAGLHVLVRPACRQSHLRCGLELEAFMSRLCEGGSERRLCLLLLRVCCTHSVIRGLIPFAGWWGLCVLS